MLGDSIDSAKKRIFRSTEISKDQWTVLNLPPSSFSVIVFSVVIIGMSYIIMLISTLCIICFDVLKSFLWGGFGHFPLQSGHQHSLVVCLLFPFWRHQKHFSVQVCFVNLTFLFLRDWNFTLSNVLADITCVSCCYYAAYFWNLSFCTV